MKHTWKEREKNFKSKELEIDNRVKENETVNNFKIISHLRQDNN